MRSLFAIQLVVGLLMLGYAGVVYVGPIARTDSVLTQEQLLDEKTHQATLDVMRSLQRPDMMVWLIAGSIVTATSAAGLISTRRHPLA